MYSLPGILFSKAFSFRNIIRSRFFRVNSLKELFDTVEPVKIFSFLKEIGTYNKI